MPAASLRVQPGSGRPLIIGLCGPLAAGKTEVAAILKDLAGLVPLSLGAYVAEEVRRRGMEPTREALQAVGSRLREERGAGCFAAAAVRDMASRPGVPGFVVDGLRHPDEVEVLRRGGPFLLLAVDAPLELRFRRNLGREYMRQSERERFLEADARELGRGQPPWGMHVRRCMDLARPPLGLTMVNQRSLKELRRKVEQAWLGWAGGWGAGGAPPPGGPAAGAVPGRA